MDTVLFAEVLTRRDTATGQPAYDYQIRKTYTPAGRFMDRAGRRYELTTVIVRRYEIV